MRILNVMLRARTHLRGRTTLAGALCFGALTLAGCRSMSDVDASLRKAVNERSSLLGGDAIAPTPAYKPVDRIATAAEKHAKHPESINPGAQDLAFPVAPPLSVRERLARLDQYATAPPDAQVFTLQDAFRQAQQTAPEFLSAEEDYLLAAIRLLIQRHLWGPRLFNDTSVSLDSAPERLSGGSYRTAVSIINTLRATQRLPYGGEVEARWIVNATDQLRNAAGDDYVQSSQIVLSGNIPLLRGAGYVAREDLIDAERNLVYAARTFENFRRTFLVQIARDYFDLVRDMSSIENQAQRLESLRRQQAEVTARVDAGRSAAFERRDVEQSVLSGESTFANARERFLTSLDRFKIRLGIPVEMPIRLAPVDLDPPEPDITPNAAAETALRLRLDLQNRRDRFVDAQRAVDNASNALLPELNVSGSVGLNTERTDTVGGLDFRGDQTVYRAAATLSLPLDREQERLNLRSAQINLQRSSRDLRQFEDNIILEARQAVREIDRARFAYDLQLTAVEINELRLKETELKSDTIEPRRRLEAQNDLLQARNDRDAALRDLRIAILNYLLATGQLRVTPDGAFQALKGMFPGGEPEPADQPLPPPPEVPAPEVVPPGEDEPEPVPPVADPGQ